MLHSGKTVIQHIYDSHYEGADEAAAFARDWKSLQSFVDTQRYTEVLARLEYQAGHAIVWRDAICNWFFRTSGIPDSQGRVGNHPDRIEAESMQLDGFVPINVDPWENASGGKAIECQKASGCSAKLLFDRAARRYEMDVRYFDQNNGASKFRVLINDHPIDEWIAETICRRRNRTVTLPPGVEFPRSRFVLATRFASKDFRMRKNMLHWITLSCTIYPSPDKKQDCLCC